MVDLSTVPKYLALSYTWGPPNPTKCILTNGGELQIRENLCEFLKVATYTYRVFAFWIDHISVNQDDHADVSQQVHIMADIFREAHAIIAYVGPGGEDFDMFDERGERNHR